MANDPHDPFSNQLNDLPTVFKQDLLSDHEEDRWPRQIEFVARKVSRGSYPVGLQSRNNTRRIGSGKKLDEAAADHYLTGLQTLVDSPSIKQRLPDELNLGSLLVEFSDLQEGLIAAESNVPPGEVLARLTTRNLRRQTGEQAQLAHHIQPDVNSPHELVAQLSETPELATELQSALPETSSQESLSDQLGQIDLTTKLWDHQLKALANWIDDGMTGYVNMATATGKTVLGLAAVAHVLSAANPSNPTPLGSLHPMDQDELPELCDETVAKPSADRPADVLIVTTDNLLGVQWARLFQEHCQTPPEYTKIEDRTITLPNLSVDIRSAGSLTDIDPSAYRLVVFDEVHNYNDDDGWGQPLQTCIEHDCPVLALTGSVTEQLETLAADASADFPESYTYTHEQALDNGVIPEFEWSLMFTGIQTDTEVAERFSETAKLAESRADCAPTGYTLSADKLAETDPSLTAEQRDMVAGEYETPSQVASALRDATNNTGDTEITDYINDETAPTKELETLAHGLDTRTLDRINLRASLDRVVSLAEAAIHQECPTLILTRSYKEAKTLWQELYDRHSDREVKRFEQGQSASEHADTIAEFDAYDTNKKILIAPGKYIGQGKDIQSVEVGINLSKQGSGMSVALIQRLGRLLRNAVNKNTVEFYHVMGTPPADSILPADGKSFVQTASEFFGQVIEPDTQGILKPPSVIVDSEIRPDLIELEEIGAPTLRERQVMTDIESAYVDAITSRASLKTDAESEVIISTNWFNDVYADYEYDTADNPTQQSLIGFSLDSESESEDTPEPDNPSSDESQSQRDSQRLSDDDSDTGVNIGDEDWHNFTTANKNKEEELDQRTDTASNSPEDAEEIMTDVQNTADDSVTQADQETIEIDRSVAALIEITVRDDDSAYETTPELVEAALDPFIKSLIESTTDVATVEYTDSDTLSLNCGPALEELLTKQLSDTDGYDEASNLILDGLLEALNLGNIESEITVPSYDKYRLGVETLVENEESPVETPGEVVQIAIEHHLDIRDSS